MDSILISMQTFSQISPDGRREILNLLGLDSLAPATERVSREITGRSIGLSSPSTPAEDDEADTPADLTAGHARSILARLSPKSQKALKAIASSEERNFLLSNIVSAYDLPPGSDLRGVWAGITRSVRTVLGDPDADLIWWELDEAKDDYIGTISPMTYRSLRKAFGLTV